MFRARKECCLWHFASQILKVRLIVPACDVFATASLQAVAAGLGTWQNRAFTQPRIKWGSYASSRSSLNFCTTHRMKLMYYGVSLSQSSQFALRYFVYPGTHTVPHDTFGDLPKGNGSWRLSFQELQALHLNREERTTQDSVKKLVQQQQFLNFCINLVLLSNSYNMQYYVYSL